MLTDKAELYSEATLPAEAQASREGFSGLFDGRPAGLAPMAGFTTPAFRTLAAREGAAFTVTELVSARGIRHDPSLRRSARYLVPTEGERPWAIQLFGHDPDDFSFAIDRLLADPLYQGASFIDLNMGCPAPKLVREGDGCALMADPRLAESLVAASFKAASPFGKPVTAKIRSGLSPDRVNALDMAKALEAGGASMITVHGRTLDQFYRGEADWGIIRQVKEALTIPVFGNGDLSQPGDLDKMDRETGCDGFMVGRAARGNPFIFRILGQDPGLFQDIRPEDRILFQVTTQDWLATMIQELDMTIKLLGEGVAVREMRSTFAFYLRGFPGSPQFRSLIMKPLTRSGVIRVLEEAAERRESARLLY